VVKEECTDEPHPLHFEIEILQGLQCPKLLGSAYNSKPLSPEVDAALFEAALSADGRYVRADILNPVGRSEWDIIEAKSTTSVIDVHIPDLAFRAWVFTEADVKIRQCFL